MIEIIDRIHAFVERQAQPLAGIFLAPIVIFVGGAALGFPVGDRLLLGSAIWLIVGVACYLLVRFAVGLTRQWEPSHCAAVGALLGATISLFAGTIVKSALALAGAAIAGALAFGSVFGLAAMVRNKLPRR
jgi:hypothetical protein